MKARNSSVLASASKIVGACALSVLLVACGGGTSGDVVDEGLDGLGGDELDVDEELTGDNLDGLGGDEDLFVDADGNGVDDANEGLECKGVGGSDATSKNSGWIDNCWLGPTKAQADTVVFENGRFVSPDGYGPFFLSTYVQGMQRILACREHAGVLDATGIDAWADGNFGPATMNALRDFQEAEGLLVDGRIGSESWNYMQGLVFDLANRVAADSDEALNAYGVTRTENPSTDIDCSQVSNFYGEFATEEGAEDLFSGWQLATEHGAFSVGPFSTANP